MSRIKSIFITLLLTLPFQMTSQAMALEPLTNLDSVSIDGSAKIRWELKDNLSDFNKDLDDRNDFIGSSFSLGLGLATGSQSKIYIQPRFTKTFGAPELTTSTRSSGSLRDSRFDVHQAFVNYTLGDGWEIWVGRQELAYGNHLVIGNVGWSHVGRSFDALRARYKLDNENSFVDLFWSQIEEKDNTATFTSDDEFSGLYLQYKDLGFLTDLDAYVLYSDDQGNVNPIPKSFVTYGSRLAMSFNDLDVELELTGQTEFDSSQVDAEVGYKLNGTRVFVGYGVAHKDYQQLYPTAHKFLGVADLFGRRNIKELRAGVVSKISDGLMTLSLQYHSFARNDDSSPIYSLGGGLFTGSTGAEQGSQIADELDMSFKWNFVEKAYLLIGAAYVKPGEYLKSVKATDDDGFFTYVQTGTSF